MPRFSLPSARAALARPAVLATTTSLALAGMLGGGLLVARATDSGPVTTVDATASPTASSGEGQDAGQDVSQSSTTSGGDDNVAVAANTRDGSTVYAVRLKVRILNNDPDTVDSGNAAVAVASCADCQTVAIALEGIVVTGDAETVAPQNIALAINQGCTNCQTLAYAYQDLQTVDGKARMTGQGRRRVAALRQELNALRHSGLDVLAVKAEVDRIAAEFAQVLDTTIVPLGRPAGAAPAEAPGTSPSATSTPSAAEASPAGTETGTEPVEPTGEPSAEQPSSPESTEPVSAEPSPTPPPSEAASPTPTG